MRAARLHGFKDLRIEEIAEPACVAGTVKIQPRFNGLCGSDLHGFFIPGFKEIFLPSGPHPLTGEAPPIVFGHEFSGVVVAVGANVTALRPGDHVAVMPSLVDGTCAACRRGARNCCRQHGFIGVHGGGGGLSDAIVVKEELVFKLPESVPFDVGALVEPLAVGWHGVRMAREIGAKTRALVFGGGPIGCAVILALVAKGVETIMLSEPTPSRAEIARSLGATHVFDPRSTSIVDEVNKLTDEEGIDVVFDCAGVNATLEASIHAVRAHGQIMNLAVWSNAATFDPNLMVAKEATWRACLAYTATDFEEVIEALSTGAMKPQRMITKRIPLDKIVEEGLEPLHSGTGDDCKILVDLSMPASQ